MAITKNQDLGHSFPDSAHHERTLGPERAYQVPTLYATSEPVRAFPFLGLGLLLLAACGGPDAAEEVEDARVRIEDVRYNQLPGNVRVVSGRVRNTSSEEFDAQVQVALYDADNQLVTTMSLLVQDVPPDSTRAFRKVLDLKEDVQGARVRSVLVF